MRSSALVLTALAATAALLTGCSADEPGTPAPPAATTAATSGGTATTGTPAGTPATGTPGDPGTRDAGADRVVLTRSGGFAGNRDTVTVEPDGRWTTTDRAGATRAGRLDPAALDRLRMLVGPATRGGAGTPSDDGCADTYRYQLTVGTTRVDWTDCPTGPQPPAATQELAALLLKTTTG
ncbi:hypothetical protein B5D80_08440 [Micromonospora wenchangensis]|uniref:DUF3558 domain-containing protein n=1 Tax=Micromonospora wenchangensis TaxID=1185415 RepID=A0A246RRR8_9ACTN|nr:hypothetical protein [Micromonospora wenchangensis]OWV09862.1 hypothetical protein B5D80_08440 [Micromonospora wenchangensis]